jgi:hypothetical protein
MPLSQKYYGFLLPPKKWKTHISVKIVTIHFSIFLGMTTFISMGPSPDLFQRIGKTRLEEGSLHRIQLKFHLWNNLSGMKYFVDTQNNRITLGNSSLKAA